ncbi:aminopeptidase N-like [Prorops nasuta]|uniref:aminopeptidase N-like n=1 Tax=Prorops nasuta TaxID=863751 RepID=UPI0034CD2C1E
MNQRSLLSLIVNFSIISITTEYVEAQVLPDNNEGVKRVQIQEASAYRLPGTIIPTSYNLRLLTHLSASNFTYDGKVDISIKVLEETNTIVLHAFKLEILQENTRLLKINGETLKYIALSSQQYDQEKQFYLISPLENLQVGRYILKLSFVGEIVDDVFGFYRSSYGVGEEQKWIGLTQFSPIYARRAFPCMDEPYMKATYNISIGHYANQTVTSNTQIQNVIGDLDDSYRVTTFKPTPPLPTYLVGWILHTFKPEKSKNTTNDFQIWTRDSMIHRGSYALNQGHSIIRAFETFLGVKNPIGKIDQFAVPDFHFTAMENWGLITYRESAVLYDETPTRKIFNGLSTMAHEYSHSWFGNLVTPRFWDVAWLKEGFASYFQYFSLSLLNPEQELMDLFTVDYIQPTLLKDSVNHTRSMNGKDVGNPSSVMASMDFVAYKKAGSIIRTLRYIMGENILTRGLQNYLLAKAYGSAVPEDLYEHLQALAPEDIRIKDIMNSWTNQPGYPLVTVTRNYTAGTTEITQEKFCLYKETNAASNNQKWWIPLTFTHESQLNFDRTTPHSWLKPHDESQLLTIFQSDEWVIFNLKLIGYYRVNYDTINWMKLAKYLKMKDFEKIHRVNRASLLDDAFNLARAGYIDYLIPFNLSAYLTQETDYEPWIAAINSFNFLNKVLQSDSKIHRAFKKYVQTLLNPIYGKTTYTAEPTDDLRTKLKRDLILSAACTFDHPHCLETSTKLFKLWISGSNEKILPDLKSSVYCIGIRTGTEEDWLKVWDRLFNMDLHTEQELLINALGCISQPHLIDKFLNASISDQRIRKQYRLKIVDAVLNNNPANVLIVLEFLNRNLKKSIDQRGEKFVELVLTSIEDNVATEEHLDRFQHFVNENRDVLGTVLNIAEKALLTASNNVHWVKKYSSEIAKYIC